MLVKWKGIKANYALSLYLYNQISLTHTSGQGRHLQLQLDLTSVQKLNDSLRDQTESDAYDHTVFVVVISRSQPEHA